MGVPKAKKAQKPRFCARNARKQGFQTPKAHKNADFVLGRTRGGTGKAGIGTVKTRIAIGKRNRGEVYHIRRGVYRNRGLPANHRARSKNVNTL